MNEMLDIVGFEANPEEAIVFLLSGGEQVTVLVKVSPRPTQLYYLS